MKFLIDVNASGSVPQWLIKQGHDVSIVSKINPRMTDADILNWAQSEQRIIITTDSDFEEMVWRQARPHCGILRLANLPRAERMSLLQDVLERHGHDLENSAIVIADSKKFRVRKSNL